MYDAWSMVYGVWVTAKRISLAGTRKALYAGYCELMLANVLTVEGWISCSNVHPKAMRDREY